MALPAPSWASSEGVRRSMRSNRPRDTRPEVELRSALHAAGLRFRKHHRPIPGARCEVDVAFTRLLLAVQLDGCFWHGCPEHATRPVTNAAWWSTKLDGTVARDRENDRLLRSHGWEVLRFWEHQPVDEIVAVVCREATQRRCGSPMQGG
ncbi:MAG: very short patch repair endonuclease [Actinomycetota bacterium]|nr:very short patch repair endonuclease [Actinomycetota bacterium]